MPASESFRSENSMDFPALNRCGETMVTCDGTIVYLALAFGLVARADTLPQGPYYSAASIVNSADNQSGMLAPNTIATIYGSGMAYNTRTLQTSDLVANLLPTVLSGTGVRVLVGGIPAGIYYVSPVQINFLVPSLLLPGPAGVQVVLDSLDGPLVTVQLGSAAPAIFQADQQTVIAIRLDGTLITSIAPAHPGDYVTLFATGLGQTIPPVAYRELPTTAAFIQQMSTFQAILDGAPLDAGYILYAGVAPGFAGLYQINLQLPDSVGANPEIRVGVGGKMSPPGLLLPVQP
jgi:uncharacterized protein (TIGR03437 family)